MLRTMPQNSVVHKVTTSLTSSQPTPLAPSLANRASSFPRASNSHIPRQASASFSLSVTPPLVPTPPQQSPSFHTSIESPISKSSRPHPFSLVDPSATAHPTQPKWRVTPAQKETLLVAFDEDPYPELAKKAQLAEDLGVTVTQVSKWFQHRRESLTRLGQFKAQYNRTRRTPEELDVLQNAFDVDRYPTAEKLAELEAQLPGVTTKQIKLWFKHRRKQVQKRNRTALAPLHSSQSPQMGPVAGVHLQSIPGMTKSLSNLPIIPEMSGHNSPMLSSQSAQQISAGSILQQGSSSSLQFGMNSHPYYNYKGPQVLFQHTSQFSEMEHMALKGAMAVSNGTPTAEGLSRLAQLLNKAPAVLSEWFRSQAGSRDQESYGNMNTSVLQTPGYMQSDHGRTAQRPASSSHFPSLSGHLSPVQAEGVTCGSPQLPTTAAGISFEPPKKIGSVEIDPKSQDDVPGSSLISATRPIVEKQEGVQPDMLHQIPHGLYAQYVYPAAIVPHASVPFSAAQTSSPPSNQLLAPLRYAQTTASNVSVSSPYQPVWYSTAQGLSKG